MSKSIWKQYKKVVIFEDKKNLIVYRFSRIRKDMIGNSYQVHNGLKYLSITVTPMLVGYTFGDFCLTRKFGGHPMSKNRRK